MNNGYARPIQVRRTVILIEMEDGTQHGYQVVGPTVTIEREWDDSSFSGPYERYEPGPVYGTITAWGVLTGLVRMPSDAFGDEPEVEPHRDALPPVRYELEAVQEPVDVCFGEVVE